jgi:hypothetical protein
MATAFADQPFATRLGKMGDEAEQKFEEVWDKGFEPWGLRRPKLHVPSLPERVRHAPDYITSSCFVECKGVGADQILKIKVVEYSCMQWWNQLHPVRIFVWDSKKKRHTIFNLPMLTEWINGGLATLQFFPEAKAYFAVPCEVVFGEQ